MADTTRSALDTAALRPGDHVAIHGNGPVTYCGYVEETMPQFNIVWIREKRTGERKILFTDECCISQLET
ncbi:hypothetical protein AB6813_20220 [bacterium RCC_150]